MARSAFSFTIAGDITSFNAAAQLSFSTNLAVQFPGFEPGTLKKHQNTLRWQAGIPRFIIIASAGDGQSAFKR